MTRFPLIAALVLAATSGFADHDHDHDHGHEDHAHGDHDDAPAHVFAIDGFEVLHPWAAATKDPVAYVFMELTNESDAPVTLLGAETDIAKTAEIVGFAIEHGTQVDKLIGEVPVAAGREMHLEPDVMAIRLTGLSDHLEEGAHMHLHLDTSLGELEIEFAIEPAGATQHSHAGHAH